MYSTSRNCKNCPTKPTAPHKLVCEDCDKTAWIAKKRTAYFEQKNRKNTQLEMEKAEITRLETKITYLETELSRLKTENNKLPPYTKNTTRHKQTSSQ